MIETSAEDVASEDRLGSGSQARWSTAPGSEPPSPGPLTLVVNPRAP